MRNIWRVQGAVNTWDRCMGWEKPGWPQTATSVSAWSHLVWDAVISEFVPKIHSHVNTLLLFFDVINVLNNDFSSSGSKPVDYPDWCEIIRKPDSCTSVAVMRVNHKLPCLWGQGRLRPASGQPWKSDNDPMFWIKQVGNTSNMATCNFLFFKW